MSARLAELVAQQSDGRADMAAATEDLLPSSTAGADRFAALARYGDPP